MTASEVQTNGREPRETMSLQLRTGILTMINELGLKPGDRLPTEAEICSRFGVARSTAREALKHLEQEGMLYAVQGQGRFLSPIASLSVERPITKYESLTEMLEGLGYVVSNAVLDVQEGPATAAQAGALGIAEGDRVINITRLRFGNDEPMVFSAVTIVGDALPGPVRFRDWSGSLVRVLETHGHRVTSSVARIRAVDLPEEYAERYQLSEYGPWLLTEETCLTQDGLRVLYADDYHRGDKIAFNMLRRR